MSDFLWRCAKRAMISWLIAWTLLVLWAESKPDPILPDGRHVCGMVTEDGVTLEAYADRCGTFSND